jgi:hypothetical protein
MLPSSRGHWSFVAFLVCHNNGNCGGDGDDYDDYYYGGRQAGRQADMKLVVVLVVCDDHFEREIPARFPVDRDGRVAVEE